VRVRQFSFPTTGSDEATLWFSPLVPVQKQQQVEQILRCGAEQVVWPEAEPWTGHTVGKTNWSTQQPPGSENTAGEVSPHLHRKDSFAPDYRANQTRPWSTQQKLRHRENAFQAFFEADRRDYNREEGDLMSGSSVPSRIGRAFLVLLAASALVLQGGAAWGVMWVAKNETYLKDRLVAYQFDAPEDIKRYVEEAGLSPMGELYLLTSLPKIVSSVEFDRYCTRKEPGIGVLGCYTNRDGRIYLFDVTDERLVSIEPVVAAHEMLHAAWARLSVQEKERLAILLEEGFAMLPPDHQLRDRIATYEADNPASRIPELYAILGTEIRVLPADLEAHYAIYFSDRTKVVNLSDEVYRVFSTLSAELEALVTELESRAAEIEGLRFTYEQANATLQSDIKAFNDRANAGGFTQEEFASARSALVERQNRLLGLRETLEQKINDYNNRLEELNRLNAEVGELNQGINVTLREADALEPSEPEVEE
jgi:hypothetical protein